ncbi:MAG: acyl-CoA dehydrogenase family protein [Verrucomicrobiales bacterium]|nr:acyl-CoA dehydrogenase family protein [Verrucomicrobiales bacterium]
MNTGSDPGNTPALATLPGDEVRQIMWRFADRVDLQMLVQSARAVARGPVARAVATGTRNTHDWTPAKAELLKAFDESGITAAYMDPAEGGYIEGPKNLALALIAFELAWVDAGAATASLAGNLGLAPIAECGTPEQRAQYMSRAVPPKPGETRAPCRFAFALTEPLPFVGVETSILSGKVRIAEWPEGGEPILQVEKRGRFITNMAYANVVTAAVDSDDPRIKGSCMIILEETDPGVFDRGTPTKKFVHQLSSTSDPVFNLRVPASRIIGGYTIKDGVIVPNRNHSEVIEAVFRRTRVTVGLMTAAKLLSAIEPVIQYARARFRGGEGAPGTPRYDLGLLQKEDVPHRLIDVWATGEAAASLGFAAARLFDQLDPLEKEKDRIFAQKGLTGRAAFKELAAKQQEALATLKQRAASATQGDQPPPDTLVQFVLLDSLANVLCPACKLWNTGHGANMMREAVSLMGGYGITEDCPGFLGFKWIDAQLEATYEGPEAVQRLQLSITMTNELFLAQFEQWIAELEQIARARPGIGALSLANAMRLWLWTLNFTQRATDPAGARLYHKSRQAVTFQLADALCWLLAARQFILDVIELAEKGTTQPALADALPGIVAFYTDLCCVQAARAAGEVGKICAELVYGYLQAPGQPPGAAHSAAQSTGALPAELGEFVRIRQQLDESLAGCRLAKDRAAKTLTKVMVRETLDYPA